MFKALYLDRATTHMTETLDSFGGLSFGLYEAMEVTRKTIELVNTTYSIL